ncbi:MAG: hypothetical protein AAB382_00915 [Chloroflexota bacterium]
MDIDLTASYAYADSYSDLGLFEMVGHPVAVYPDKKLADLAREKGWRVVGDERGTMKDATVSIMAASLSGGF